jgi:hypothetical protein
LQVEKYVVEVSGEGHAQCAPQYHSWHMFDSPQEQVTNSCECHSKHEDAEVVQQRPHLGTAKPVPPQPTRAATLHAPRPRFNSHQKEGNSREMTIS